MTCSGFSVAAWVIQDALDGNDMFPILEAVLAGTDRIEGSVGNGGSGADYFHFTVSSNHDTIMDFEDGVDLIQLNYTNLEFDDLDISYSGGDAYIEIGGVEIKVLGAAVGSITEADIDFYSLF